MRVLFVEDSAPIRAGVTKVLAKHGHQVVPVATVREALSTDPTMLDVALIDLRLADDETGLTVVRALANQCPCLVFTQSDRAEDLREAISLGAAGYLLKSDPPATVIAALEQATRGQNPLSAAMTRHLMGKIPASHHPYTLDVDLTASRAVLIGPNGTTVHYRSDQSVSLLFALGQRWSPAEANPWLDDEDAAVAVWGREHLLHTRNNLNVLIHRVRTRAKASGLDHPFLIKRPGRLRLDVGDVRGCAR